MSYVQKCLNQSQWKLRPFRRIGYGRFLHWGSKLRQSKTKRKVSIARQGRWWLNMLYLKIKLQVFLIRTLNGSWRIPRLSSDCRKCPDAMSCPETGGFENLPVMKTVREPITGSRMSRWEWHALMAQNWHLSLTLDLIEIVCTIPYPSCPKENLLQDISWYAVQKVGWVTMNWYSTDWTGAVRHCKRGQELQTLKQHQSSMARKHKRTPVIILEGLGYNTLVSRFVTKME